MKWKKALFMVGNNIPKEIKQKVKAFLNAVKYHFHFLENNGYSIDKIGIATEYVVDNVIEVIYKNINIDRLIIIHYEPNDIDDEIVDLVSISIFKDIKYNKEELVLKKYLEKYKSNLEVEHLSYPNKNNKPTFKENMEMSISGYAYFLKDTGANLINGIEWENGLKFDWSAAEDVLYQTQKDIIYDKDTDKENDDEDEEKNTD